ncbi:MAG: MoxR family ATPase [Candidatus Methylumidiphilus sp.]
MNKLYQPKHLKIPSADWILEASENNQPYVFNETIAIVVDVALATHRPLLVSGNPGCGKSRLADAIAAVQGWSLLSMTMTSRTRLESLTAEVDQLRRLHDAQARPENSALKPDACYLKPGLFWWAFQPETARYRGMDPSEAETYQAHLPYRGIQGKEKSHAVLLIDEIDKAEPDLPNDLLEPLDQKQFDLPDGFQVHDKTYIKLSENIQLLTIITTNGERELPQAFLRRCVLLRLPDPEPDKLVEIALKHFPKGNQPRIKAIADKFPDFRVEAKSQSRRPPGISEFLDAINACEQCGIEVSDKDDSVWKKIENAVLVKGKT